MHDVVLVKVGRSVIMVDVVQHTAGVAALAIAILVLKHIHAEDTIHIVNHAHKASIHLVEFIFHANHVHQDNIIIKLEDRLVNHVQQDNILH